MNEQSKDHIQQENKQLRDKLAQLETDRINLMNEKDKRERDCRNM